MSKIKFTQLFKYMKRCFDQVDQRFDIQDKKIDEITGAITELGRQLRDYYQNMILLARKVNRLERWTHKIAKQTGVKPSEV